MMTRLRGNNMNGFRATVFPNYSSPSPPIYPAERKLKKPLMEKHRRERMNKSMNELKERIVQAHPHESSKLEKADILEKAVLYVNELEIQTDMARREKAISFQQGYLQACHELVELIAQQQTSLQTATNSNELKQKLRQTVEKHLKSKCSPDALLAQQQQAANPALSALNPFQAMQFVPNRNLGRPMHHPALPFMMPPQFQLNCLPRLPVQPTTSSSLFPFPATQLPRPIPTIPNQMEDQFKSGIKENRNDEPVPDEEIDVEKVDEDKNEHLTCINTTTEDSGLESPTSAKSSSDLWRPF